MWIIPNRFYDTYPCVQDTLELTSDAEGGLAPASISETGQFYRRNSKGERWSVKLRDAVESLENNLIVNWPTPRATKMEGSTSKDHGNWLLETVKENWPTARTSDAVETYKKNTRQWATPLARDHVGAITPKSLIRKDGRSRMDALPTQVLYDPTTGLQDQTYNNMTGKNPVSLKLNPNWVEQLMGLPVGWTQIKTEQTD